MTKQETIECEILIHTRIIDKFLFTEKGFVKNVSNPVVVRVQKGELFEQSLV